MNSSHKGDDGETRAAEHLAAAGYHILKRNLRCRSGEVDIVVYRDDWLVFVEVKTWQTISIEDLERSINARKRARIQRCAAEFVAQHPEWRPFRLRFDIVHVATQITHFENAFTESGFQ